MSAKQKGHLQWMPLLSSKLLVIRLLVPKEGFEPTHPCGYYALNVARLPFRHFGTKCDISILTCVRDVGGRGLEPRTSRV